MPDAIKAALTTPLSQDNSHSEVPLELQYMPPGTHRINASRAGAPVSLEITVDATTAETLNDFLQAQLTQAADGSDDRPFFDFNHEDREAAAWPTEFYWAGDDLKTGGVRAKVEWSGAGQSAVKEKTFRRFSPTFIPDAQGRVIGSETNMGGLVNRAAFKHIQPLFAKGGMASVPSDSVNGSGDRPGRHPSDPAPSTEPRETKSFTRPPSNLRTFPLMTTLQAKLHSLKIIDSVDASEDVIATAVEARFTELQNSNELLTSRIGELEAERTSAIQARAANQIQAAVLAGRLAPKDEDAKSFWKDALIRDEAKAVKALEALPINPVLAKVTEGDDPKTGLLDKMQLQQSKLNEVRAANPQADFQTVFAKAQTEAPELFR